MNRRDFQVSVGLDEFLREFVEAEAVKEDRSLASVVRRCVAAEAARRSDGEKQAA